MRALLLIAALFLAGCAVQADEEVVSETPEGPLLTHNVFFELEGNWESVRVFDSLAPSDSAS